MVGCPMDRAEQVSSPAQIVPGQLEEGGLGRASGRGGIVDGLVVPVGGSDGLVIDRWIGGETGDQELVDVALERPLPDQVAGDVVEPDALAQVAELLDGSRHAFLTSLEAAAAPSSVGASYSRRSPIRSTVMSAGG